MTSTTAGTFTGQPSALTVEEARAIAKESYVYGFPLVDNYRVQYSYFVDKNHPEYKGDWNMVHNTARVYTPDDKAIQTPNSDTPYSFLGADLRAEPIVITVPEMEEGRYYSLQFIDMYTFNFTYVGSRATGNKGGTYLLTGPGWSGDKPEGVDAVIRCETQFAFVLFRTQLFDQADIENVKKIQAGYHVQSFSEFLGKKNSDNRTPVNFVKPLTPEEQTSSLQFFNILNFVLQFCPTHTSEQELMQRFAQLDIGAGKYFDVARLSAEIRQAIEDGIQDAWELFSYNNKMVNEGKISSADSFGTREHLKNNYGYRFAAAKNGIYGNSAEEAIYGAYFVDSAGEKMNGTTNKYQLRFAAGQLPPVHAFWSLTLYKMPESLLSANPINRYLINSPMLTQLKKDNEGGITLYVQHESPGSDKESNWLPAPSTDFICVMRLYWPRTEALEGKWKKPEMVRQT